MDASDLIWEAHAGIFPAPGRGWEALRAYRDAGVTHLVHTQGYDSPAQYAEIVQQIDGEIRAAL